MNFFAAVRFLTIFPAPQFRNEAPHMIGRSIPFFPVVGLLLGIILAGLYFVLRSVFPLPVVSALLVTSLVIMTGAHHLDGLIDTCDAIVAGKTREQRLNIMSDTGVGAFGITGVCLLLILKYAAVLGTTGLASLIVFPMASRWALGSAILIFPSAKNNGMGFAAKSSATWAGFISATILALIISIMFAGLIAGPLLIVALFALVCCLGSLFSRLYGGLTGDCYGALVELGEILFLLLATASAPFMPHIPGYDLLKLPLPAG